MTNRANDDVAIEVRNLSKAFMIPGHQENTLKGRLIHRSREKGPSRLQVLDEISFEVKRGEFFGVIGRNGSGKSTLLKLLAGIYRADAGQIRIAPKVAPVIELGVGFQAELAAEQNVMLNAEMIGLSSDQARECFDDVIRFAELEDFVDLKLKNYSSGMRVRLAFAIALHSNTDVFLLDEVLAVGDAAFQRKCEGVFRAMKRDPEKTVVLVTHGISRIERFCDRAMLLDDGQIEAIGEPRQVARRYAELLREGVRQPPPATGGAGSDVARIDSIWLESDNGDPEPGLKQGDDIRVQMLVETAEQLEGPHLRLAVRDGKQAVLFAPPPIDLTSDRAPMEPGDRVQVEAAIENRLAPGHYTVTCSAWGRNGRKPARASRSKSAHFTVLGGPKPVGRPVTLDHEIRILRPAPAEPDGAIGAKEQSNRD